MHCLDARLLYRVDDSVRICGPRHFVGLGIDTVANVRAILAQFLQQGDRLGRLLLREQRKFEGQQFAMSG